jgi:hypothetical protein
MRRGSENEDDDEDDDEDDEEPPSPMRSGAAREVEDEAEGPIVR